MKSKTKRPAILAALLIGALLLIAAFYFLNERRKENEAAQRELINAVVKCGGDIQFHLNQAEELRKKNPQLSFSQACDDSPS